MHNQTNVLAVFANPEGSDPLRLATEHRTLQECIQLSPGRDLISLDVRHAATVHDLRRALLQKDYQIVHFSGHATHDGLVFEDHAGGRYPVAPEALALLLSRYPSIDCCLLNACYSSYADQADIMTVPYVIGMSDAIGDASAIEFTRGFYDAIGAGRSIAFAFDEGCTAIRLQNLPGSTTPVLLTKQDTRPTSGQRDLTNGQVHICYATRDGHAEASRLRKSLGDLGTAARLSTANVEMNTDHESGEADPISGASHVLVCVTPGLRDDISAAREIEEAHQKNKPLVALLYPGGRLPISLVDSPAFDFSREHTSLHALLRHLNEPPQYGIARENLRAQELRHLQKVAERYNHWRRLYTDLRATTHVAKSRTYSSPEAASYLELRHALLDLSDTESDPDAAPAIKLETLSELLSEILRRKRVAIVGEPGSGKTTTLERLAYELASDAADDPRSPIPVLVDLGTYQGGSFSTFVDSAFGELSLDRYPPDRVVVLLDGLNEMPAHLVRFLRQWLEDHPAMSVIVTCRTLDYSTLRLPLKRIDVAPLDVKRIYWFIRRYLDVVETEELFWSLSGTMTRRSWEWFRSEYPESTFDDFWYGRTESAPSWEVEKYHLRELQRLIAGGGALPDVLGVVSNPFLLFVVVQLYAQSGRPPTNRGQLFNRFVSLLIQERRSTLTPDHVDWVDEGEQRRALACLATAMLQDKHGTALDAGLAMDVLARNGWAESSARILRIAVGAGLIELGAYVRFSHQLLQEYFATQALKDDIRLGVGAEKYWPGDRWWEPTGWEEPAIFLAGLDGDATDVVRWLTRVQPTLAYRCAFESGATCAKSTIEALCNPASGDRTSPLARAEWGRRIASDDDRPGVGVRHLRLADSTDASRPVRVPDVSWCKLPAGTFVIGGDLAAWNPSSACEIHIPYEYFLAKYPVTCAQFAPFVEEGAYFDDRYWSEAGMEWRGERVQPRYWTDERFHHPNHPVIGISWFEAYAYSVWLNEQLGRRSYLESGLVVRLPTETEWERAGRFPDGRLFPWGDIYEPGLANIDETDEFNSVGPYYLRTTTAVGMFEAGRNEHAGLYDMSGTVWEWCLSKWADEYEYPEDNDPSGVAPRVLRGGSWSNNESLARCASRHRYPPGDNGDRRGFRLCLGPIL